MDAIWYMAQMTGGPLDGASACVPLRKQRVDHWVWAHECVTWNADNACWEWADACVSGFYQLSETAGSSYVDSQELEAVQTYKWHDVRFAAQSTPHWEFGD